MNVNPSNSDDNVDTMLGKVKQIVDSARADFAVLDKHMDKLEAKCNVPIGEIVLSDNDDDSTLGEPEIASEQKHGGV